MTATDAGGSGFSMGRAVSMTFDVIGRNLAPFFILALISVAPQTILGVYLLQGVSDANGQLNPALFLTASYWIRFAGVELVAIFLTFFLQATLTYWTVTDLRGTPPSLGDALATGFGLMLPLFAIGILYVIGLWFGFVLLIVPGLILLAAWSVVVPAFVVERTSIFGGFSRSSALTKGSRWPIFAMIVVFYVGVYAINFAARPVFGLPVMMTKVVGLPIAFFVFQTLIRVVTSVVGAAGSAAIYYELRSVKEGVGPQQLASVFD